jgi:hypothetical protein
MDAGEETLVPLSVSPAKSLVPPARPPRLINSLPQAITPECMADALGAEADIQTRTVPARPPRIQRHSSQYPTIDSIIPGIATSVSPPISPISLRPTPSKPLERTASLQTGMQYGTLRGSKLVEMLEQELKPQQYSTRPEIVPPTTQTQTPSPVTPLEIKSTPEKEKDSKKRLKLFGIKNIFSDGDKSTSLTQSNSNLQLDKISKHLAR